MVKLNPQMPRNSLHLLTAAVAGPALLWAGFRYPGSWKAKGFLMLTGIAVVGTHYYYFKDGVRHLLPDRTA